jgi:NADP-dependent 3-hydroxy acid dehydrogenase YdfG
MFTPVILSTCAPIVISGRRDEAGQALAAELRGLGVPADFQRTDVRIEDEIRDLIEKTIKRSRQSSSPSAASHMSLP